MKKYLPLILIVILASILRFTNLDRIPTAMSGDELLYAITAKSVYLTGHDLSGTWNPLSALIFRSPPNEQQAELPYFLHIITAAFPFSLINAKLPFATLSVGIVVLLTLIATELFGRSVGLVTGIISAINPWLLVMGRTGYESTPATFFFLLGLYTLLTKRAGAILWSILPLMLAFYSYIGTKLIFVPFVVIAVLLSYIRRKQYKKQFVLVVLSCIALTVGFLILIKTSPTETRIGELFLPTSATVSNSVNEIRKASIQFPFLSLTANKYTVYIQELFEKVFRIFSPTYLFVEGDQFFLPAQQSFFYYIDFFFLALGSLIVFTKKRTYFFIVWVFILIGTFPHLFHKTVGDFSGHLALMFPFMIILIGAGVAGLITSVSARFKPLVVAGVIGLYAINLASFAVIYFAQTPLIGYADFPLRVLTRYIKMSNDARMPLTVYSTRGYDIFKKYLFYSNAMDNNTMPAIRNIDDNSLFTFNGVQFSSCPQETAVPVASATAIYDIHCVVKGDMPHVSISRLSDAGEVYKIVNDTVCQQYQLQPYPSGLTLSDFSIESLSDKDFCTTYISKR